MATPDLIEIRGEIDRELVDVIDAIASAEHSNRMSVLRQWIRDRAETELHRATLIVRVAGNNGRRTEPERK